MEERKMGTILRKSPKQGLTSAKDLPIELPRGTRVPLQQIRLANYPNL